MFRCLNVFMLVNKSSSLYYPYTQSTTTLVDTIFEQSTAEERRKTKLPAKSAARKSASEQVSKLSHPDVE
jgi:hypothetical protein